MAIIQSSSKLSSDQDERRVCSGGFVFFRLIREGDVVKFMTATASEDTGEFRAFQDQKRLLAAAADGLFKLGKEPVAREDWAKRPYVEATFAADDADVLHVAHTVLLLLGFDDDITVLALREGKAQYDDLAIDDTGDDVYLSDRMWWTADGRLVER